MIALLAVAALAATLAPAPDGPAEQQIRRQREAFNGALARRDLAAIATFLADNAQIMTGRSSLVFSGRAAQIGMWWEDFQAPSPIAYVRTPERIELSPVGPMALETGRWRGVDPKSSSDWATGSYSAKWRQIEGRWLLEGEIYMTTACAGKNCPKPK